MKQENTDGTFGASNPIEAEPSLKGNLVLNQTRTIYRFATKEEKEIAARDGKNLYISHFGNCPDSKKFRNK